MICIAGKNDIATNVLAFVVAHYGAEHVVAIANRDDAGQASWQHSLSATAKKLGVQLISLQEAYELTELHFFSVEFDRIVVPTRFRQAELYNIHFSLLPSYKGVYTAVWPILDGQVQTGVTLHRIEAGIDTGPIIHQRTLPIGPNDTARDVYYGCLALGYEVLRQFIPVLVSQPQAGIPQAITGSTYYGPKSIDYSAIVINLRQTAYQIHNTIRAFTFQEYQLPLILGRRVRSSEPTENVSNAKPGTVLSEDELGFSISTIDYDLYLVKDYTIELFQAIEQHDVTRVQTLARLVPDLEIRTRNGWTPLMVACYHYELEMAVSLLEAGADVNQVNLNGTSVFMYAKNGAVNNSDTYLLTVLLKYGDNINWRDKSDKTVLDYCRINGNEEIVSFLLSYGAV